MLGRLKLPAIAALFEDLPLKAAKANLTHEAFLYELVRGECLQRDEHRIAHLHRMSGLPPDKTFRTLQLDRFPALRGEQLERLRSGAFLDDAINVVADGKRALANRTHWLPLATSWCCRGTRCCGRRRRRLVQELLAAKRALR